MKLFGLVGGKNAGKTELMARLVADIAARDLKVSTVKHAEPVFDVDAPGKDSYRHREAGAGEVLLSSRKRFALMHELRGADAPQLDELLTKLAPVDLVLIEGYETAPHPKIEAFRGAPGNTLLATTDETVRAVASDTALTLDRPVFDLNATLEIAEFILKEVDLA